MLKRVQVREKYTVPKISLFKINLSVHERNAPALNLFSHRPQNAVYLFPNGVS